MLKKVHLQEIGVEKKGSALFMGSGLLADVILFLDANLIKFIIGGIIFVAICVILRTIKEGPKQPMSLR